MVRRAAALLACALVCVSRPGLAQPNGPTSATVEIVLVGEIGRDPAFSRRVTSWFEPERFRVTVRRVARLDPSSILSPKPEHAVYAWVLLHAPHHARIYFACASGSQAEPAYLLRDLELESGLDEMGSENMAQVLHLSVVALLDGQAASRRDEVERELSRDAAAQPSATSRAKPTEPLQPVLLPPRRGITKTRTERAWIAAELGLGYGVSLRGDEGIWHGPRAAVSVRANAGWALQASAQGALPITRETEALVLRFYGGRLTLAGGYRYELGRDVALQWALGPGLELVKYRPLRSLESNVSVGSGDTEARPGAVAAVSGVFGHAAVRFVVGAEAMVPFTVTRYNVVVGERRRVVGRAVSVVPSLFVGAVW